jgi:hydroxymethylpyrimidine pyrophosphatase-like HAD family hydrolase
MANAVDELKEAADELTSSCDEDGIAEALYRHLPELK